MYHTGKGETVLKIEKNVKFLKILKQTPTVNKMNLIGLDGAGSLFKINIDGLGAMYGAEVIDLLKEPIELVSEGSERALYLVAGNTISHFDLGIRKIVKANSIVT